MRKELALLLTLALLLALPACGGSDQQQTATPEQAEYMEKANDIALTVAKTSSDLMQIATYEIQYTTDYKTLHNSDPTSKELADAAENWYTRQGGNWATLRRNYEHVIVTFEALQKTDAYKAAENAVTSRCLHDMYKNIFTLFQYAVNGRGSSSDVLDASGKVVDALKAYEEAVK